jgi:hypothetical protein
MRPFLLGLLFGAATRPLIALFSHYEVPLSPSNLVPVLLYLFLIQGVLPELAAYAAARLSPPNTWLLLVAVAFPLGQALDPALHALYVFRPHRLALTILYHVLVAAPWLAALVRREPTTRLVLQAGWRLALVSVLDRETGWATAVLVLLLAQLARDAIRAWRSLVLECS